MLSFEELFSIVRAQCTHGDAVAVAGGFPGAVRIPAADIAPVCQELYRNPGAYFDMLSCLTAIDLGPEAGSIDVVYNLYSIPFHHHLALKVSLPRDEPVVDSVTPVWRTADWHEREAFDLVGVRFRGHPDLRRILLPADWEGFPLRKDYVHQDYYRDVKVKY